MEGGTKSADRRFVLDPNDKCDVHLVRLVAGLEAVTMLYQLSLDMDRIEREDPEMAGLCNEWRGFLFGVHAGYVCEALAAFAALDEKGWFEKNEPDADRAEADALLRRLRELTPRQKVKGRELRRPIGGLRRLRDKLGAHWDEGAFKEALLQCQGLPRPPGLWTGTSSRPEASYSPLVIGIFEAIAQQDGDFEEIGPIVMEMGPALVKLRNWWLVPVLFRRGAAVTYSDLS